MEDKKPVFLYIVKNLQSSYGLIGLVLAYALMCLFVFQPYNFQVLVFSDQLITSGIILLNITIVAISLLRLYNYYIADHSRLLPWLIFIIVITASVTVYFSQYFLSNWQFGIWRSFKDTVLLSFLPILFLWYRFEEIYTTNREMESDRVNKALEKVKKAPAKSVKLHGKNRADDLDIIPAKILFLKADDNYSQVYYLDFEGEVQHRMFRESLSSLLDQLKDEKQIIRCHRSYAVNIKQIDQVSGNSRGHRLHMKKGDYDIPVSRNFPAKMMQKIREVTD